MKDRILLVEDDANIAQALRGVLEGEGFHVAHVSRGEEGLARIAAEKWNVVLTDFKLPGLSGLELVRRLRETNARLPVILMTAHGTTEVAIEATKYGAYDYLLKPFEMPELIALARKAAASGRLAFDRVRIGGAEEVDDDSANAEAPTRGAAIIGQSRAMQTVYKEIGRVAATNVPVLIRGETGTGKELVARAICQYGDRAGEPFIAVNCAAIPETLLESELFGHEKGAFTGADARRIGRFEQAHRGTLFLDEIGDLSANTQAKLLRALQERTIQRVGGRETIAVDARVIAATHRDLEAAMREKTFREDLFYRLDVASIRLPPLRDRTEDIPALVQYFLRRHGPELGSAKPSILPEALCVLGEYPWPGNVRELENAVRKALLLTRGFAIGPDEARQALTGGGSKWQSAAPDASADAALSGYVSGLLDAVRRGETQNAHAVLIEAAERELCAQAIDLAHGNQTEAARWLGVSRLTLREKLKQFGLYPARE